MMRNERFMRFVLVGFSSALINLLLTSSFVEGMGFKTYFLKNLANILAIEITIIYHFVLSRTWTWMDIPKKQGRNLLGQFIYFHLAVLIGLLVRIALFAILEKLGIFYLLNVAIGIILFAAINFVLYDRVIFREGA